MRKQILQYFYDRNKSATSQYGKKGSSIKISDAKKELKQQYGLTQQEVMSNLTYLIDKGWINKEVIEKTIQTRSGSVPSSVTWYEISATGIDKMEGESEFKSNPKYAGINIHAAGSNVITLGDGNYVNAEFQLLHAELEKLKHELIASNSVSESNKFDLAVDIESIKEQLAKSNPDKGIIKKLWSGLEKAGIAAGLIDTIVKISQLIEKLF